MTQQGFTKDLVSMVTPVYNGQLHLSFMLDSVLRQTYPKIEMILVDDGSTDGTLEVAKSYIERFKKKGFGYHVIEGIHKNASGAINYGLPYVGGEYLIWPDSDDVLEPESVEKRVRFLEEHPDYQCVRSLSYYFDREKGVLDRADEKTGDLSKEDLFWDILESKTFVCCGCYMLRSSPFFEIYPQRRIPEYHVGQNFQMLLPFMYHYLCPTLQERLYGVCVREGSHSRTALTQEEEERKYQAYEHMIDEIADICGIKDRASKHHIRCWKMKRRYSIAQKYGKKPQMLMAVCQLCLCGGIGREEVKAYVKRWCRPGYQLGFRSGWFREKKTWLYWRVRIFYAKLIRIPKILRRAIKEWMTSKATWLYWRIRIKWAHMRAKWKRFHQDRER